MPKCNLFLPTSFLNPPWRFVLLASLGEYTPQVVPAERPRGRASHAAPDVWLHSSTKRKRAFPVRCAKAAGRRIIILADPGPNKKRFRLTTPAEGLKCTVIIKAVPEPKYVRRGGEATPTNTRTQGKIYSMPSGNGRVEALSNKNGNRLRIVIQP